MSTITYFVRSHRKGESEVSIWLRLHHAKTDLRVSTGIKIPAKFWDKKHGVVKIVPHESVQVKDRLRFVEELIYAIKHKIYLDLLANQNVNSQWVKQHIDSIIKTMTQTAVYAEFTTTTNPSFIEFIKQKINSMERGEFLNKGEHYTKNAIDNWRKFLNVWRIFESTHYPGTLFPDDISMETYYDFMAHCDSINYKKSTKYQYARLFKAAMNYALVDGVSKNRVHLNRNFSTHASIEASKGIYLSMQEIFNISELNLPENSTLSKVRDLFLLGCYTGMRFSDYSLISSEDIFHFDIDGRRYSALMKTQKKTKQRVAIPLLSDETEKILNRYGGRAPKVSIAAFNREIKHICKMAGIEEKVRISEMVGNKIIYKWTTKDQLVSSHTARRSCITNLYLSGKLDTTQIRDISGHKSEQAFQRYICLNAEENVKSIFKKLVQ